MDNSKPAPFDYRRDYRGYFIRGLVAGACLSAVRHGMQGNPPVEMRTIARNSLQEGTAIAAGARAAVAIAERDYTNAAVSACAGLAGVYLIERMLGERQTANHNHKSTEREVSEDE
ncbi:hypothetical protein LRD18_07840 [Halorhodospira halochloris]|uniref:Uncharacterized protein n=1 Tax=Halorhodospira halochloris TaxID=1052 RepID=A0A0X8X9L3_HALHR|nr:hypothetical protein [Halorhodospira halochloris]MBK1652104.1 hypothetical protein [Halorhodospira halochloris]MCG5530786.1 hypothetical protein [Halorhodospira halochloris]BAU58026.1 hypothetical protein HH1059_13180 [Halorhodospira halochloris]